MKKLILVTSILLVLTFFNNTLAEVYTSGAVVNNDGSTIVIGNCFGSIRVAGQELNLNHPSAFLVKLNTNGDFLWIKILTSTLSLKADAITVDNAGNFYITGEFSGTANFDSFSLTANGTDVYIAKYNSQGNVEWVKQGSSPGEARGNDITVSQSYLYVCGDGSPVTFDSLTVSGGGFTVKYNLNGEIQKLFNTGKFTNTIHIDSDENMLINQLVNGPLPGTHYSLIGKYSPDGIAMWMQLINRSESPKCTDNFSNIYLSSIFTSASLDFYKRDTDNNLLTSRSFSPAGNHMSESLVYAGGDRIIASGKCSDLIFGSTTIVSNGSTDAFVAVLDTGLNPVWMVNVGGSNEDEFNKVCFFHTGDIFASGNFCGTINLDTLQISGGTGIDNRWTAAAKFSSNGNLIWFKKIAEDLVESSNVNWFPLEVGNKWQFFKTQRHFNPPGYVYSIETISVIDSISINNKKFFTLNNLVYLNSVPVRFDLGLQKIVVYLYNQEHTYMDFNLPLGATFQQIQQDGTFYPLSVDTGIVQVIDVVSSGKGFQADSDYEEGWYMFVPDIGFVFQDEHTLNSNYPYRGPEIDMKLLEYLIYDSLETRYKKHTQIPDIQFEPIVNLSDTAILKQQFVVDHQYSVQNYPQMVTGVSYIKNVFLESFYYNGFDSLIQAIKPIPPIDQKLFSLNYQFDTTKYNQGYHLYYRIAAVDKGIVADTFYSPPTGFYKLFWRDSTTSVTQLSPEVFDYSLSQNFPNPFNPSTKISFSIPEREFVSLKVFDILGEEVATLVNKELDAGKYEVDFDGKSLSSGIYIYQLRTKGFINSRKMLLIK